MSLYKLKYIQIIGLHIAFFRIEEIVCTWKAEYKNLAVWLGKLDKRKLHVVQYEYDMSSIRFFEPILHVYSKEFGSKFWVRCTME